MEFVIDRKQFLENLSTVARAISPFSPMPALSGILIEVEPDQIVLTGSDSTTSIRTIITPGELNQLQIKSPGSVVIEARYLLDIVRKQECTLLSVELTDYALVRLSSDTGRFHINGSMSTDYPGVDFSQPAGHFRLKLADLHKITAQTVFACSDKEQRPVLTGVNFHASGNVLCCSASDSYRLARKEVELEEPQNFNITISSKSLQETVRSLGNTEEFVDIYADRRKIQFVYGKTVFQTRLIDGVFPAVDQIIPTSSSYELEADAQELFRAIDRTNFILNEKVHLIHLQCAPDNVRLKVNASEIGNSDEKLKSTKWTGEPLTVTLNGSYVADALKALNAETVVFSFTGAMMPILITNPDDDSTKMVVVPVRSYEPY